MWRKERPPYRYPQIQSTQTAVKMLLNAQVRDAKANLLATLGATPRIMYKRPSLTARRWSKGRGGLVVVLHTATSRSVNLRLKRIDRGACRRNRLSLTKCLQSRV
jgi:hypothetical protein